VFDPLVLQGRIFFHQHAKFPFSPFPSFSAPYLYFLQTPVSSGDAGEEQQEPDGNFTLAMPYRQSLQCVVKSPLLCRRPGSGVSHDCYSPLSAASRGESKGRGSRERQ